MKDFYNEKEINQHFDNMIEQEILEISNAFAKILQKLSQVEKDLLFKVLDQMDFEKASEENIVLVKNEDLKASLGWNQSDNKKCFSDYIFKTLNHMRKVSRVDIGGKDAKNNGARLSAYLFYYVEVDSDYTRITFNKKFLPLFELSVKMKGLFAFWVNDIYSMHSKHTRSFYLELIEESTEFNSDVKEVAFTTEQLKGVFGLSENAYMDKDAFNRYKFEKRTVDRAVEELSQSKLIELIPYEDGMFYQKAKNGKFVDKYKFKYRIKTDALK